jgi:hypothetical protein
MGMALGILFLVCLLIAVITQNSEESAAVKSQTKALPDGALVFFDKRVSGHSRKGVVTYYSHFVRAVCPGQDGCVKQEIFPFNNHDMADKAAAWGRAHSWVIDTHSSFVSKVQQSTQMDGRLHPGVTTLEQVTDRLGKPESITNAADGQVGVVWVRPKAAMDSAATKGVTILFDKDGKMIRIVKRKETETNAK